MAISDRDFSRRGGGGSGRSRGPDFGEGGGLRRALRRIFVEGDDFFNWALPLFTVRGIRVRIHLLYIVIVAAEMFTPIVPGAMGYAYKAVFLGTMFLFVLLHEFGHVVACRVVGGEADDILMWPLGGLAACRPPHHWKPAFITTVCGPLVNLAFAALFAGVLATLAGSWRVPLIDLFAPWASLWRDPWFMTDAAYWKVFLFNAYIANLYLFLFNAFMPMFPLDGGRMLQELLWPRVGFRKSMQIAVNVGLVSAAAIAVLALGLRMATGPLFGIALFAGLMCFNERRRLAVMDEGYEGDIGLAIGDVSPKPSAAQNRRFREIAAAQERARRQQAEVDRILAKIAGEGMAGLNRRERAILKEATERKRAGD